MAVAMAERDRDAIECVGSAAAEVVERMMVVGS